MNSQIDSDLFAQKSFVSKQKLFFSLAIYINLPMTSQIRIQKTINRHKNIIYQ